MQDQFCDETFLGTDIEDRQPPQGMEFPSEKLIRQSEDVTTASNNDISHKQPPGDHFDATIEFGTNWKTSSAVIWSKKTSLLDNSPIHLMTNYGAPEDWMYVSTVYGTFAAGLEIEMLNCRVSGHTVYIVDDEEFLNSSTH
jgi:hypothetical protein